MRNNNVLRLTLAALFLALGILLPFLTGNNRELGQLLSLMHIPMLLCGFVCGPYYGLAVGFCTPLLRSVIVGMPPLYPTALMMAFELAAYGLLAGLLFKALRKLELFARVHVSLVLAMIGGRLVWGLASFINMSLFSPGATPFTFTYFLTQTVLTPWPGILLHLAIIPPILLALKEAKLFPLEKA